MANSGVTVDDECLEYYDGIKMKKKYRYVFYKLSDCNTRIVLDKAGDRDLTFDDFYADIKQTDGRFALLDYPLKQNNSVVDKLCFVSWCPSGAAVKKRMLHSSSKDAIKKKFHGLSAEIQATEEDEITEDIFEAKTKKA